MSAAHALGVAKALPQAQISYERFHVVAMAMEALDRVRLQEMSDDPTRVRQALDGRAPKALRWLMCGMRHNPATWSRKQIDTMHWLQRSGLKSARAWRGT